MARRALRVADSSVISESAPHLHEYLSRALGRHYAKLSERLDRCCRKAETVAAEPGGNTLTVYRWELVERNPSCAQTALYATEQECSETMLHVAAQIVFFHGAPAAGDDVQQEVRRILDGTPERVFLDDRILRPLTRTEITFASLLEALQRTTRVGACELPLEYLTSLTLGGRHEARNLAWVALPRGLTELRAAFGRPFRGLLDKVQTKAYLTDRRQTGTYYTNREKRWETHPSSPQFADRSKCMEVELKLLGQTLTFGNLPEQIRTFSEGPARELGLEIPLGQALTPGSFRCPLSGQAVDFEACAHEAAHPTHGESLYHIGHIQPLATPEGRHVPENVSWMTELGNRIQGESPLEQVVKDIFQVASYHKERLGLSWEDVERITRAG